MNPRLSLQGRVSLDGWNGVRNGPDRGIDMHMDGVGRSRGRHGRRSSIYQSQTTTLFSAFEESDGDPGMLPSTSRQPQQQQHRKRQSSTDLHQLEEEEMADGDEDEEGVDADRQALLRKVIPKPRQQQPRQPPPPAKGSRNQSRSPVTDSSLTDVRITPR